MDKITDERLAELAQDAALDGNDDAESAFDELRVLRRAIGDPDDYIVDPWVYNVHDWRRLAENITAAERELKGSPADSLGGGA